MNKETIIKELNFKAVRSSGAGGQHVNKVSSKVMLEFDLANSGGLNDREKTLLYEKMASRLTSDKILQLSCDESRSQLQNKTKVIQRFFKILKAGLYVPKRRLATKPTKGSITRKREQKQRRSEIKNSRKKPNLD